MTAAVTERPFLTVAETAAQLGVSEKTIRRRIASGELQAVQLGRPGAAIRIDAAELERFVYGPGDAA